MAITQINVSESIKSLKVAAAKEGLDIRFRDRVMDSGDFCIFIYDRKFRPKSYTVGFDGSWDKNSTINFEKCLKSAYNWIKNRDNRFEKVNSEWRAKAGIK